MKFISLSSDSAGYACAVSQFYKKYFSCNDNEPNNFFDYLMVSMSSINKFLIDKDPLEIDTNAIVEKNGFGNFNVKFLHYDLLLSIHDLVEKNDVNQMLEKYERRRNRFFKSLSESDLILFFRFCTKDESLEIKSFIENMNHLFPFLKYKLIILHENEMNQIQNERILYHRFQQLSIHDIDNYIRLKNQYDPSIIQYLLSNEFESIKNFCRPKNNKAIVVLTRGYSDPKKYNSLIERNKNIEINLDNKIYTDIIIFHEGNISYLDQQYIQSFTPNLHLQFISIKGFAFLPKNADIPFHPSTHNPLWTLGYRHMCHFWFVDFWHCVNGYEKILRIDEDIKVDFNIDKIFDQLDHKSIIAGKWADDDPKVTINLIEFCNEYYQTHDISHIINKRNPHGPYSNVMGLNIFKLSQNESIKKFIKYIDDSGYIYHYRWGDLPLWGEIALFFIPQDELLIDTQIRYYHDSLRDHVNAEKTYHDKLDDFMKSLLHKKIIKRKQRRILI